jgi:hypothetical protein
MTVATTANLVMNRLFIDWMYSVNRAQVNSPHERAGGSNVHNDVEIVRTHASR